MTTSRLHVSSYIFVLVGLASFSFSPILVRLAGDVPALTLAFWRNTLAILMLAPFAVKRVRPALKELSRNDKVRISMAGILLGVHFYFFFEAIKFTTVASATVFVSVTPIFLAVLGYLFLRERLPLAVVISIAVAVAGGILVAFGDSSTPGQAPRPILGNLFALIACLFVSIYLLIGRVVRRGLSWIAYVFPLYSISTVTLLLLCVATGAPLLGFEVKVYLLCTLMAIGPQIAGHGSFNYAVKFFPAAILGLLALTEPVGATVLAFWLFDELPGAVSLIGMGITLGAVGAALWGMRDGG